LNRHLQQHEGEKFKCPIENCNRDFSLKGNMTRHVKEFHNKDSSTSIDVKIQKQHVCPEIGCGKTFKFASKLEKHKDSHGKLHLNVLRASFSCVVHNLILYLKF